MSEEKKKPRVSYEVKRRYEKKAFSQYRFQLHRINDADVIEKLGSVENKTDYIRQLIRNDIKKN